MSMTTVLIIAYVLPMLFVIGAFPDREIDHAWLKHRALGELAFILLWPLVALYLWVMISGTLVMVIYRTVPAILTRCASRLWRAVT